MRAMKQTQRKQLKLESNKIHRGFSFNRKRSSLKDQRFTLEEKTGTIYKRKEHQKPLL
jgi:hypothetical protein